jgi:putative peptidoglycan lipid II flippase
MSRSLLKSTATVSSMTLISRIFGLLRDIVLARVFGASPATDAFLVAFKIPNFLRRLFAEGAFSQSFVPVLAQYKALGGRESVRLLVDRTAGTLGVSLVLLTAAGVLAAPLLIMDFAPGFLSESGQLELAAQMLRITLPYLLFIALTALAGGILNSHGRFAVPAFTPVLLNLALIGAALWIAPQMANPIIALAWGVLVAGVAQLALQIPALWRLGLLPRPRVAFRDEGVGKIRKLMMPAIFGASVTQLNLLIDTLMASFLVSGSITWLYYSDRLVEFPLGILGIALSTVILPYLSFKHAASSREEFARTLDWALRWVMLIGAPATLGLLILAPLMLATLFQYGEFEAHDVNMATRSLRAYALGLPAFILIKVLAPAFYARQDTRSPVRVAVIATLANIVFNLLLIYPLAHVGLALATTIAAWMNAAMLLMLLRTERVYAPRPGWWALGWRVACAAVAMIVLLIVGVGDVEPWLEETAARRAAWLATWVLLGGSGYFFLLWSLRAPLRSLMHR